MLTNIPMQLSEQCITLEQAQKLYELNFRKASLAEHVFNMDWSYRILRIHHSIDTSDCKRILPAYTVSELMEYLPQCILQKTDEEIEENDDDFLWNETFFYLYKQRNWEYNVYYMENDERASEYDYNSNFTNKNLAQALWDMLIYLIENKHIEI